jgi:glycosyltransferase involved in cell wall biosynthesis
MTSGVGDTGGPTHDTMPALAQSVPIVSVIISMRDMAETVGVAVRSIICQTLTDWELILIDDGSRDDGAARVAAFGDPRIRIIRHETSRGIACRHNEAARLARGEFIAVMDADDICYPERLAVQVAMLRSDPTIDVVASQAVVFRGQGEVVGSNPYPLTHDQITANPYKGFPFLHATWCGKTAWFRSHPYDERLWRAEDMGLLLSAAATSRFATVDKILFAYRREHISLSKKYIGLASYSRAVWWHARRTRNRRRAVKQILAFVARIASDAVIIGLGGGERLFKQRHMPLTNAEALTRWQAVWSMMSGAGEIGGPTHDTMQALAQPVPTVSLVMSMRDMAATVEAAVRSIIYQTLTEWELVLIDDGSRDDSAARVAAFGDSRIRIIRHKRSKGLACRLNEAVRLARGEFIARMDADDICYPERLAVQVEMLRSDPTIDLLGSKAWIFRRQGEIVGFLSTPATHDQIASEPYRGLTLPHPTWCGKAAWFRNHPYDERVRKAEDQDLLMRTAGSSRFAATDKILLGYRREHISILKRLRRRMSFSHAIWRHAQQTRDRRRAVKRIVERFKSLAADAVTIVLSGEEHLVKLEATSLLNPDDLARWRAVWTAVSDNMPAESQRG